MIDTLDTSLLEKYEPEVYGIRDQLLNKNTVAMILILCGLLKVVMGFRTIFKEANIFPRSWLKWRYIYSWSVNTLQELNCIFYNCTSLFDKILLIHRKAHNLILCPFCSLWITLRTRSGFTHFKTLISFNRSCKTNCICLWTDFLLIWMCRMTACIYQRWKTCSKK